MPAQPRTIFIAHASKLLTDHLPSGDGLAAFNFITRLGDRGHRLHVVADEVELREPLPSQVTIHRLSSRRHGRALDQLRAARQVRARLDEVRASERVDLVHQLNPVEVGLTCMLPADSPPIVLGPYMPDWPAEHFIAEKRARPVSRAASRRVKWVLRQREQGAAAALLLTTPAAAPKLTRRGAQRALVRYIGLGVDAQEFAPGANGRVSGSPATILFLANLWVRKGILVLLAAFDEVAERMPGCRLLVAGDGSDEALVRDAVERSPHRDRIELLGRLDRAGAAEAMRAADVYCLPSFSEPFGISALEAMSSGCPVVATDVGGLAYLVRSEGGRTVPPGDAAALAAALVELLSSEDLRREMGSFNRALVESTYSWDAVMDQLEAVYDEVAPAPPSPRAVLSSTAT
jgi:L-malate glycosyltransferase